MRSGQSAFATAISVLQNVMINHTVHNRLFSESLVDWPRMKASFDDIIARYPDADRTGHCH